MHEAGHSKLVLWDNSRDGVEREVWEVGVQPGGDTCIPVADSCCYKAKTITVL